MGGLMRPKRAIYRAFLSLILILVVLVNCTGCFVPSDKGESDELTLFTDGEKELKVLQFADMHFGVEGTVYHNSDVERTLEFIDHAINSEKPDLIVLLGDNMMTQGVDGAKFIVETFDKYQVPYTLVFGNHDATSYLPNYRKSDVSEYLENCDSPYLLYKSGYTQDGKEDRYGNFSISIRDEETKELLGAFVLLDTGTYDYDLEKYQEINEGQIAWYEEEIARLNALYSEQESGVHSVIPTITYGHIPLPEHSVAYQKALRGEGAEMILPQENFGWMPRGSEDDTEGYSFFDAMVKMQSAKAYICGHYHVMNYHVKMDGIILGFCPQTSVSNNSGRSMRTISYTIDKNFDMKLNLVVEPRE